MDIFTAKSIGYALINEQTPTLSQRQDALATIAAARIHTVDNTTGAAVLDTLICVLRQSED